MPKARPHLGNQHRLSQVRVGSSGDGGIGGANGVLDLRYARKLLKEAQRPLTSEQTHAYVEQGAKCMMSFVRLLQSPNDDVRQQAVRAIGFIAGDSAQLRDYVLSTGGLEAVIMVLNDIEADKTSFMRDAACTLRSLCSGKPPPPFEWVSPALVVLANLIQSSDVEVLTDTCWALSSFAFGPNEQIGAVIDAGVCHRLVELLLHRCSRVQTHALRAVGNITTGDETQKQFIIDCGVLPALRKLSSNPKQGKAVREKSSWLVTVLTAPAEDDMDPPSEAEAATGVAAECSAEPTCAESSEESPKAEPGLGRARAWSLDDTAQHFPGLGSLFGVPVQTPVGNTFGGAEMPLNNLFGVSGQLSGGLTGGNIFGVPGQTSGALSARGNLFGGGTSSSNAEMLFGEAPRPDSGIFIFGSDNAVPSEGSPSMFAPGTPVNHSKMPQAFTDSFIGGGSDESPEPGQDEEDVSLPDPPAPVPPDGGCSWEWPLSRQEKKTRVGALERNIQMVDQQLILQELAELRKFRHCNEGAWKEHCRQRKSIG